MYLGPETKPMGVIGGRGMINLKQLGLAVAALLCLVQSAGAQSFNQLFGFGDSTLDTGWYTGASSGPHATGVASVDASIAASLAAGGNAHPTGPGLGSAQLLAGFFGLSANSASFCEATRKALVEWERTAGTTSLFR